MLINNVKFHNKNSVLDVGCGEGIFLNQLSFNYKISGIGIDLSSNRVTNANRVSKRFNLNNKFLFGSFKNYRFKNKFDIILCLDVLEHVNSPGELIEWMTQSLKKGGRLVIQTPKGKDEKLLIKDNFFSYGKDKHLFLGFEVAQIQRYFKKSGLKLIFYKYNYFIFSQLTYEILDIIRRKSMLLYSILWPLFLPPCLLENKFKKSGRANGLFVIGEKK